MATKNIKSKTGFTIIEVVLVLAVAGLIFLMVFIALPALQRSQRDTQRRQSISQVQAALTQYQTNNSTKADNLPKVSLCKYKENEYGFTDTAIESGSYANIPACQFIKNYLNENNATENVFLDPDGMAYSLAIRDVSDLTGDAQPDIPNTLDHTIYVWRYGRCNGEAVERGTGVRNFAVVYKLEGAGVLCLDNS